MTLTFKPCDDLSDQAALLREIRENLEVIAKTEGEGERPRDPLSWESVARMSWDHARYLLAKLPKE